MCVYLIQLSQNLELRGTRIRNSRQNNYVLTLYLSTQSVRPVSEFLGARNSISEKTLRKCGLETFYMELQHSKQLTDLLETKRSGHVFQCLYQKQRFTVKFSGSNANLSYCCLLLARSCCMLNSGWDLLRTLDWDPEKSVSSRQRCGLADDVLSDARPEPYLTAATPL